MPDVLLIEDDDQVRGMLVDVLEAAGLTVRAVADGREGLAAFRADPAAVVVTDLYMPHMDGLEVIQVFHRLVPEVRIIAVSGGGTFQVVGTLEKAEQLGAYATLEKPFHLEDFVAVVRKALG
jgi:DNA-binding NtrC family response regulator